MSELLDQLTLTRWRLQPIVSAHSGRILGCEVLTQFPSVEQAEHYFRRATPAKVLALFTEQREWVSEQENASLRYFCNLPVSVLSQASFRLEVTAAQIKGWFPVIELQDPESIALLSDKDLRQLMRNLAQLQRQSISLWLDDVTPALLPVVRPVVQYFDGIKIDKGAFWRLADSLALLKNFVEKCHQLSPLVLIEGIETPAHCQLATEAGANYLQGFLWPDIRQKKPGGRYK